MGLTVACARCHDHKFDAISTKDYYALYGYLQSSRHQRAFIDPPDRVIAKVAELRALKDTVKSLVDIPSASPSVPRSDDRSILFEDFESADFNRWTVTGEAFGSAPSREGDFSLHWNGPVPLAVPAAAGQAHSGLVSDRLQGVLRSRSFLIEKRFIHYLASGRTGQLNLVVDGFEKIRDPIYGGLTTEVRGDRLRWYTQDVSMWIGHRAYVELSDGGTVDYRGGQTRYFDGSGALAVDEIRFSDQGPPGPLPAATDPVELPVTGNRALAAALAKFKEIEAQVPPPTLAVAIVDGTGEDERVHIRGGTRTLGDIVPRRFLEAIAGSNQPAPASGSGRLELARRMVDPANPLPARVMVNRVWKHHFGRGIVPTVDDFGIMGEAPTNPALLDFLATEFIARGWSIKAMHRLIVLSSAYRMSSAPVAEMERLDPGNHLLHRMNVRRLEAESIRDTLLAASGRLNPAMYGPSVPAYLSSYM